MEKNCENVRFGLVSANNGDVRECVNLRRANFDVDRRTGEDLDLQGGLEQLKAERMLAAGPWRVVASVDDNMVVYNGLTHALAAMREADVYPVSLAELDFEPRSAVMADGQLRISTDGGVFVINYSEGRWDVVGMQPEPPRLCFRVEEMAQAEQTVPARRLAAGYVRGEALRQSDRDGLSRDLEQAYLALIEKAAGMRQSVQPFLAHYRLFDLEGHEVYRSEPVLLGCSDGMQCTAGQVVRISVPNAGETDAYALRAKTFRVSVTPDEPNDAQLGASRGPWVAGISRAEIWTTAPVHPYLEGGREDVRQAAGTGDQLATVMLPGSAEAVRRAAAQVAMMAPTDSGAYERVLVIRNPFSTCTERVVVPSALMPRRVSARRLSRAEALLQGGHRVVARVVASAPGAMLRGNLTVERRRPATVGEMAMTTADEPWRSVVTVKFADGSRISHTCSGSSGAPTGIGGLLTYPDPEAVEMRVAWRTASGPFREQTYRLAPSADNSMAVCVADRLGWLQPGEAPGDVTVEADQIAPIELPGLVMMTETACEKRPRAVIDLGAAGVTALAGFATNVNSWEYGKARFYAMTPDGTYLLNANTQRTALTINHIDRRGVKRRDAVAAADGRVFAVAGGDLVEIHGAVVRTLLESARTDAEIVAWDSTRRELWTARIGDKKATVYKPERAMESFTATLATPVQSLGQTPTGRVVVTGVDSLTIPDADEGEVMMRWAGMVRASAGLLVLRIPICGTFVDGTIRLTHRHGRGPKYVVYESTFWGTFRRPLRIATCVPGDCLLEIESKASNS